MLDWWCRQSDYDHDKEAFGSDVHGGEPCLLLSPEHAQVFKRGGFSKAEVKQALWDGSQMAAS